MLVPNGEEEEEEEPMVLDEEPEVEPKDVVKRGAGQALRQGLLTLQLQVDHCP